MKKTILLSCLAALLAAAPAMAQVNLSNYVALGDSLTAGYASASLMDWYQERSYPALLARQAGAAGFEQPLVSQPGIGPILELVSLQGPVIQPVGLVPGLPVNAEYPLPYNNLGVPGATLFGMVFATGDIYNLLQGNLDNVMFDLILRNGVNTALEQAIGRQPTFMTVWIGNNDVLGAVLAGTPIDGVTMTPVDFFAELYANAIGALVTNTSADIVLINIPDRLPFTTTLTPLVEIPGVGTIPLMADTGPLTANDFVNLSAGALIAAGYGLPGGPALPDNLNLLTGEPGYVLRAAEAAAIEERIAAYNQAITQVADAYDLPVLDANALFRSYWTANAPRFGGTILTGEYLLGGIFSYDGIHQQNIGYALIANALIELINDELGGSIPLVNMIEVLYEGDWQSPGVTPFKAGEAVLSRAAFDQLYELLGPKVESSPRIRRPATPGRPGGPAPELRRAPFPRP